MKITDKKILVTGANGFLGKHLVAELINNGCSQDNLYTPSHREMDLTLIKNCRDVVQGVDIVIHAAGEVGGIGFNREKPGDLFYDNLMMGVQLMDEARKAGVKKFVAIGTVCAYPKFAKVPFEEMSLWDGYPEETNAPYGLAKKMLLVQAQAYRQQHGFNAIYLLPTNLYGPGDNFNPDSSHVIPALIRKALEAKQKSLAELEVWGSGEASREFLYVQDAARAIVLATIGYDGSEPVNIGSGEEIKIKTLINLIKKLVGYQGTVRWDRTKPDGQPRRKLNTQRAQIEFGFKAEVPFEQGLKNEIEWYISDYLARIKKEVQWYENEYPTKS